MRIIFLFIFISNSCFAFNFDRDTTLNGVFDGGGKVVRVSAKITGNLIIQNCFLEANAYQNIFSSGVKIGNNVKIKEVSAMWWGASPSVEDNYTLLTKAINEALNRYTLFIPKGEYSYNTQLFIGVYNAGNFEQCRIKIYGESAFWGDNGTVLNYKGMDFYGVGFQLNKGSEFSNITIKGVATVNQNPDLTYFPTPYELFVTNAVTARHAGIVIDPHIGSNGSISGSTGIYIHDVNVTGFRTLMTVSQNGTLNGDNLVFERVQFGDGGTGFSCSNAQAKGCVIRDCFSWGSLHTVFNFGNTGTGQCGSWLIDNVNIAGRNIRPFFIRASGWFPVTIRKVFAERIYTIGDFLGTVPLDISDCTFDFLYKESGGEREVLNTAHANLTFTNCLFRFYGTNDSIKIYSTAAFLNCQWSGKVVNRFSTGAVTVNYSGPNFIISKK